MPHHGSGCPLQSPFHKKEPDAGQDGPGSLHPTHLAQLWCRGEQTSTSVTPHADSVAHLPEPTGTPPQFCEAPECVCQSRHPYYQTLSANRQPFSPPEGRASQQKGLPHRRRCPSPGAAPACRWPQDR